jgi:hypothetical protein
MSMEKVHLHKLLKLFFSADAARISELRRDIRQEIKKARFPRSKGGDFHTPFWTDAKNHAAGRLDLPTQVKERIARNDTRERLYHELSDGFLKWWNEKRRWQNEPFQIIPFSVKAQLPIPEVGGVVKIENLLAVTIGPQSTDKQSNRLIYPYFSKHPVLGDEAIRLGLWALAAALGQYSPNDLRLLDVIRGTSFGIADCPLRGNEHDLFVRYYGALLREWHDLWDDYRPAA